MQPLLVLGNTLTPTLRRRDCHLVLQVIETVDHFLKPLVEWLILPQRNTQSAFKRRE